MPRIELTDQEVTVLTEELESALEDLRTERIHTDNRRLHAEFLERENLLAGVITRLQNETHQGMQGEGRS